MNYCESTYQKLVQYDEMVRGGLRDGNIENVMKGQKRQMHALYELRKGGDKRVKAAFKLPLFIHAFVNKWVDHHREGFLEAQRQALVEFDALSTTTNPPQSTHFIPTAPQTREADHPGHDHAMGDHEKREAVGSSVRDQGDERSSKAAPSSKPQAAAKAAKAVPSVKQQAAAKATQAVPSLKRPTRMATPGPSTRPTLPIPHPLNPVSGHIEDDPKGKRRARTPITDGDADIRQQELPPPTPKLQQIDETDGDEDEEEEMQRLLTVMVTRGRSRKVEDDEDYQDDGIDEVKPRVAKAAAPRAARRKVVTKRVARHTGVYYPNPCFLCKQNKRRCEMEAGGSGLACYDCKRLKRGCEKSVSRHRKQRSPPDVESEDGDDEEQGGFSRPLPLGGIRRPRPVTPALRESAAVVGPQDYDDEDEDEISRPLPPNPALLGGIRRPRAVTPVMEPQNDDDDGNEAEVSRPAPQRKNLRPRINIPAPSKRAPPRSRLPKAQNLAPPPLARGIEIDRLLDGMEARLARLSRVASETLLLVEGGSTRLDIVTEVLHDLCHDLGVPENANRLPLPTNVRLRHPPSDARNQYRARRYAFVEEYGLDQIGEERGEEEGQGNAFEGADSPLTSAVASPIDASSAAPTDDNAAATPIDASSAAAKYRDTADTDAADAHAADDITPEDDPEIVVTPSTFNQELERPHPMTVSSCLMDRTAAPDERSPPVTHQPPAVNIISPTPQNSQDAQENAVFPLSVNTSDAAVTPSTTSPAIPPSPTPVNCIPLGGVPPHSVSPILPAATNLQLMPPSQSPPVPSHHNPPSPHSADRHGVQLAVPNSPPARHTRSKSRSVSPMPAEGSSKRKASAPPESSAHQDKRKR